jgi:hypothetical protein
MFAALETIPLRIAEPRHCVRWGSLSGMRKTPTRLPRTRRTKRRLWGTWGAEVEMEYPDDNRLRYHRIVCWQTKLAVAGKYESLGIAG